MGTTTEIHDYMRLLFARVGRTYCRNCGQEVVRETAEIVAGHLMQLPAGTRLLIGFEMPVVDLGVPDKSDAEPRTPIQKGRGQGEGASLCLLPFTHKPLGPVSAT